MLGRFITALRKVVYPVDLEEMEGVPTEVEKVRDEGERFPVTVSFDLFIVWRKGAVTVTEHDPTTGGTVKRKIPLDSVVGFPPYIITTKLLKHIENKVENTLQMMKDENLTSLNKVVEVQEEKVEWVGEEKMEGIESLASITGLKIKFDIRDKKDFDTVDLFMIEEWGRVKEETKTHILSFPIILQGELPTVLKLSIRDVPLNRLADEVEEKVSEIIQQAKET